MVTRSNTTPTGRWQREHFVAGHPALELANTVTYKWGGHREDLNKQPGELADWSASLGLARATAKVKPTDIPQVHAIRDAIYAVFSARASGVRHPDLPMAVLLCAAAQRFEEKSKPRLHAELAWHAVSAWFTVPAERIGECPRCGWLFVDQSKGRRRRWCSMAICGTSEKVKAFHRRNVEK